MSDFHVSSWFPGLQNHHVFLEFFGELVWELFSGRNNSLEPPVFWFSNSLPYVLEESRELRALIRWALGVTDIQKCKEIQLTIFFFFFFTFWASIMDLQIALKYSILFFLISYLEEFHPVKYYFSGISTSRNRNV